MELRDRFFQTLMRTQWLDQARLDRYCDGLAAQLCLHAQRNVPFYRDTGRMKALDADAAMSPESWKQVPILTRREAIEAGAALDAEHVPDQAGATVSGSTSGSTGSVFNYRASSAVALASLCINERFAEANGLDGRALLAQIIGPDDQALGGGEAITPCDWRFSQPGGSTCAINVAEAPAAQWAWLQARPAPYLLTYGTNAHAIAQAVLRGEAPRLRFKAVLTFAETVEPSARLTMREAFGGVVLDRYGCQEAGMLATQCPAGRYHAASEINRIEVVDDSGCDVEEGGTGRVLVTTLYNYAMPLIRYFIGDHATRASGPCPCGRSGLTLSRIAGRTRNLFRFPDGSLRWPGLSFKDLARYFSFERLQVVQVAVDRLEFRYVPLTSAGEVDHAGLREYLRSENMAEFAVDFVAVEDLPRSRSGKFEEFLCLL